MPHKIRLLLIDDHSLFRESLGRLLEAEPGLELAGDYSSVGEALAALPQAKADVVLLDFDLGDRNGLEFLPAARKAGFHGRVLLVTAGMSDADTLRALESDAAGIFLKHSPPAELVAAIHKVMDGRSWLDSGAVQSLVAAAATPAARPGTALTPRERDVLKAVFEGLTNKEIAARLSFSEGYVKAVLQQLFDKTGVRTRSQLVRIAIEKHEQYGLVLDR